MNNKYSFVLTMITIKKQIQIKMIKQLNYCLNGELSILMPLFVKIGTPRTDSKTNKKRETKILSFMEKFGVIICIPYHLKCQ